jgi:hypothetical protein
MLSSAFLDFRHALRSNFAVPRVSPDRTSLYQTAAPWSSH